MFWIVPWLLLSGAATADVGHVVAHGGSSTFSESTVFSSSVSISRDKSGNWAGKVGQHAVLFEVTEDKVLGEPGQWVRGDSTQFVVVHHAGKWYAKGAIFGTAIRIIYPDNQALEGWKRFHFDGLAAQANPPIIPFVLALWAAEADVQGRESIDFGESEPSESPPSSPGKSR